MTTYKSLETIRNEGEVIALILRASYDEEGVKFFTPNEYSQQLAYMKYKKGHLIAPHIHNPIPREVVYTREVLLIKRGKVRVDLYSDEKKYLESSILNTGDLILLAGGGHGFELLEDAEIIEVKQGPYSGDVDKTRFDAVASGNILVR